MKDLQNSSEVQNLLSKVEHFFVPHGFEVHPFLTGWYNDQVDGKFKLNHPSDTLAVVVISQPDMFERAFLPYLSNDWESSKSLRDPIDDCMLHYFSMLTDSIPNTLALHDFQLGPSRRPKVLMQTAGHVSGAVRYYHPSQFPDLQTQNGGKLFPVCHHPRLGGWFALRGVVIFNEVLVPHLESREPTSELSDDQAKELLLLYNQQWQDNRWRDVGREETAPRYSDLQIKYFDTLPAERFKVLGNLVEADCQNV
jgi:methylmalonic aciduria homocystinuria type C protein